MERSPMGGCETTRPENMEGLYASIWSWVMEEEYGIPFPDCNGVDEYRYHVEPTLFKANFAAMLPKVSSLLNYCVE